MNNILHPKIFIPIVIIIFLVGLHYYMNYRVKILLKSELRRMSEKKQKKPKENTKRTKQLDVQQVIQPTRQIDIDSYEDPAEIYDNTLNNEMMPKQQRSNKSNILMRDFTDL